MEQMTTITKKVEDDVTTQINEVVTEFVDEDITHEEEDELREFVEEQETKEPEQPTEKSATIIEKIVDNLDEMRYNTEVKEELDQIETLRKEFEQYKTALQNQVTKSLATSSGGGEVKIQNMDDIDTDTALVDKNVLRFNATTGKFDGVALETEDLILETGSAVLLDGTDSDGSDAGSRIDLEDDTFGSGVDLSNVTQDIIPDQNNTRNLGSSTKRFKELFLSGQTIDLGGATISSDWSGAISIAATGATLPTEYYGPVEQGFKEAAQSGVVAGHPVVDIKAILIDGSHHEVDSSEVAFKIAASMAFKEACQKANPFILEPVMLMEVVTPEEFLGDVLGDLQSRRAQVQSMEPQAGLQIVKAHVPLAETFQYATILRSNTTGRASFTQELDHYAPAPVKDK